MKVEIKIPPMGESISEVSIGTILKPSGSAVAMDEEILEMETEKVNQVLYAPQAGVLELSVKQDDKVKIGQVIGFIDTEGAEKKEKPETEPAKPAPIPELQQPKEPISTPGSRLTREAYVADLLMEKPQAPTEPEISVPTLAPLPKPERKERRQRMSKIRRVIAARMVEAQHAAAMLTTFNEVDLSQVIALREQYKDQFQSSYGVKLGFMSFFVKATVSALQKFPEVNASIDGEDIVYKDYFDIGIAVSTDRGVFVPVLRNSNQLSIAEIERLIDKYAGQARDGTISIDDLQGGTFTITNGGVFGSLLSTPILNPPQSAILGMHKIIKRPMVVEDQIVIRPMMYLALSYDHRIIDGKEAVLFLIHVKNCLEDPTRLLLQV